MPPTRAGIAVILALSAVAQAGCAGLARVADGPERTLPAALASAAGPARQLVTVEPAGRGPATSARVRGFERIDDRWREVLGPFDAVVGRAGFAPAGEKREGDGRTPSGVFPLELAFGYAPSLATGLRYRQAGPDDLWVDDVASDDYNRWVVAPTPAASFERLRRDDDLYELAVVIGYNTAPVVKGAGSAIFLHVWRGADRPTSGCVALARRDVAALLAWLDQAKAPAIALGAELPR